MKILVANIAAAEDGKEGGRFVREYLGPLTRRNMEAAGCGFKIVQSISQNGHVHPAFADCKYLPKLDPEGIYPALLRAQEESYDGAIIGCFGDPALGRAREALQLPVVGFGEAAMLAAMMMGRKFGIVAPADVLVESTIEQVASYGWDSRLVGVVATTELPPEQELALVDASNAIRHFQAAARELVRRGADVVIPGCGLLSIALRLAPGVEHLWPDGVREIDGVPVVDVLGASVGMLHTLIRETEHRKGKKSIVSIVHDSDSLWLF